MSFAVLILRNLTHYWRTNVAVVLGVGAAVAVLAGALLVGESVRASLRALFLQRLGSAAHVVSSASFFRESLGEEVSSDAEFARAGLGAATPLISLSGAIEHEGSGSRAAGVQVYGVDERFWRFHGRDDLAAQTPGTDDVLLSETLARELGAAASDTLLLRVEKHSDIPVESLHGRKEDVGRTARLHMRGSLVASDLGEFSLRPGQTAVRAVFVNLAALQKNLGREGEVNTLLVSSTGEENNTADAGEALRGVINRRFTLEDVGVKLRPAAAGKELSLESQSALVGEHLAGASERAVARAGMTATPVLSYLANAVRANDREVPYSVVTALGEEEFARLRSPGDETNNTRPAPDGTNTPTLSLNDEPAPGVSASPAPIILNEWAAQDLGARVGDEVTLEYYLWQEGGRLETKAATFRLAGVVPVAAGDGDLVPDYPGISEARSVAEWDPPFPVELSRIRPRDEDYWDAHKSTPKAFVPLARGQELWRTRFGALTSVRVRPPAGTNVENARATFADALRAELDPTRAGLSVFPVRAEGLAAARGATDFGEYFLYFSFFIVASALLLAALFFRLGVEQRLREIGLLYALGFTEARVRRVFLAEAFTLAIAGSLLGVLGAYAYGKLLMLALRTWWVGAVNTTALELHATPAPFLLGIAGGVVVALLCVAWTLRGLRRASARSLIAGGTIDEGVAADDARGVARDKGRRPLRSLVTSKRAGFVLAFVGMSLLVAAGFGLIGQAAGFFGGGTALLAALLCFQSAWLRRREAGGQVSGTGWLAVSRLGVRGATHRPGRSVLCIALIASASFTTVAVDSFRRGDETSTVLERKSGGGGYPLLAETLLPVVADPNTPEGRDELNLAAAGDEAGWLAGLRFARFRLRPGDDASCLNLYQPRQPRMLAPTEDFLRENRFTFQNYLAGTGAEKENPWLLLKRQFNDGAVPVIADANSLTYVLKLKLGEDFVLERGAGAEPVRLRVVGALRDSVFQGELMMAEENFVRLFPEQTGYRFFMLKLSEPQRAPEVAAELESRLSDYGFDASPTAERLASFHRVENTFISTFQTLGGLGLVLGTLGLAAVLLRNVLERRRELALLRAVGYGRGHFALLTLSENALLLFAGLLTGTACALLAVAPAVFARGGQLPLASLGALLLAVVASGLLSSLAATAAALKSPLLASLRAE